MNSIPARRKAAVWVALVFLLGGGLGVVVGISLGHHDTASAAPANTPETRHAQIVERMDEALHLTAAQRTALEQISRELQAKYKAIHQETNPQINEARENARAQIRALLTPEQQPKFEEFLKHLDEERKRWGR